MQAMANPKTNDESVLLMFDPLTSPLKSGISRETPRRRRELDPTSPVAAFFSSVDKSKSLLATVRKQKQGDLIDLGQPMHAIHEHVEHATAGGTTANGLATPLPTFRVTIEDSDIQMGPPIDPFSPSTYATTTSSIQFFQPGRQLNLQRDLTAERNSLVLLETPAKTDLLMSTNFTPVPANLPYLPNASLSSLQHSGNSSVACSGRRRRSSIDLDQELQAKSPDSSFDILHGELEIGNSADVSFVSTAAEDSLRAAGSDSVGESPWTIRTTAPSSGYQPGSGLLPVVEVRETSLLAHEIPLPDSCPTSPESSTGHNEDANINASKVFSHLRRSSMVNPSNGILQFPTGEPLFHLSISLALTYSLPEEPSPPRSPGKKIVYNINATRKPIAHVRTTSMSSISSISSSRSGATLKGTSPNKQHVGIIHSQVAPKSPTKTTPASPSKAAAKAVAGGGGSAKRLPRPSIATKPAATATAGKPCMPTMPGPRSSIAPTATTARKLGAVRASIAISTRPRSSMAPPLAAASVVGAGASSTANRGPRASLQPAPRPSSFRVGLNLNQQPLRAPRASVVLGGNVPTGVIRAPALVPASSFTPATKITTTPKTIASTAASNKPAPAATTAILAPSVRANSTHPITPRTSRPSLIGGMIKRPSTSGLNAGKLAAVKESNSTVGDRNSAVKEANSSATKTLARPRPRTSSAGATLISRPELERELEMGMGMVRPASVARLVRPKSSLSRCR